MQETISTILINLFDTTEQLDEAYKKTYGDILIDYTYSEMHCIDFIGKNNNPNVTKIALFMNLTKAAISKIIKKLLKKNAIEQYQNSNNKKEIYYKLTPIGREVYNKHLKMHEIWCNKDEQFFKKFNEKDLKTVCEILAKYHKLLKKRLDNIKGNKNEKDL